MFIITPACQVFRCRGIKNPAKKATILQEHKEKAETATADTAFLSYVFSAALALVDAAFLLFTVLVGNVALGLYFQQVFGCLFKTF